MWLSEMGASLEIQTGSVRFKRPNITGSLRFDSRLGMKHWRGADRDDSLGET